MSNAITNPEPGRRTAVIGGYQACQQPNYLPQHLAEPHWEDYADAVGLENEAHNRGACCVVHYVRHLRWKFSLI